MCLCCLHQGQAANLSISQLGGTFSNMGEIKYCCRCAVVCGKKWIYSRHKRTNSLSIDFNIRCSTLCLRNHKESIVAKLKNDAEVERSASEVDQSRVLQFCRCAMRERSG